jgi:GNAT superfamily N-acetyltransferase
MNNLPIDIIKTDLESIHPFRVMFLHENNFQFVCDKCHYYGWSTDYLFKINDTIIGYGCVWGTDKREDRDTIFEFFLLPPYRNIATRVFKAFIAATNAIYIECQSNDLLLSSMCYEFSSQIVTEALLFEENVETHLHIDGVTFGRKTYDDDNPAHHGGFFLECNGEEVAEGGHLSNYNKPYSDIYMDVKEGHRGKGYGSLIVQELKKEVYKIGRVPAARCGAHNEASKATLLKAGFRVCGARLKGNIRVG